MQPLFVNVTLFDPHLRSPEQAATTGVVDGLDVDLARFDSTADSNHVSEILRLTPDPQTGLFTVSEEGYRPGSRHFFRVTFHRRNYSPHTRQLHEPSEILPEMLPVLSPCRIPVWDSGWDDNYRSNEFFSDAGLLQPATAENPLVLRIPLRRLFVIGHRGAPFHYPENTIASFQAALDLGANALEFDLCTTRDRKVILFHDPRPDQLRLLFERFPYELVSPEVSGFRALIKEFRNGEYQVVRRRPIGPSSLDIRNRSLAQVRRWYRYRHVEGVEHGIPQLEEFLEVASRETSRLHLLFFDIKHPGWRVAKRYRLTNYGRRLGSILRTFDHLPEYLVIAHSSAAGLAALRDGIRSAGERRCLFAFDAAGSFGAIFGFKEDPLAVARTLGTSVVSVGARFRAGDSDEIRAAGRDRDYNTGSALSLVLHWTLNDREVMRRSLDDGINGIVTDRPEVLKQLLDGLGLHT